MEPTLTLQSFRGLLIQMAPWAQPFATTRKARTSEEISALQLHRHVMWFLMVFDPTAQLRFLFAVRPQIFGGPSDIVGCIRINIQRSEHEKRHKNVKMLNLTHFQRFPLPVWTCHDLSGG